MRHDAHRWVRPDAYRFMPPGSPRYDGKDAVKYFWPEAETGDFARHDDAEAAVLQHELDAIRRDFEALKRAWRAQKAGFNPGQPRVPAGNPGGGQWTSIGTLGQDQIGESLTTAPDQPSRIDLQQLQEITINPAIRAEIDSAWNASNPFGTQLREHGFWITRHPQTGELITRSFSGRGIAGNITPGPTPSDAIAFFHTHPLKPDFGGIPGPSRSDRIFADSLGLPGLIRSHRGMHYFGPELQSGN